MHVPNSSAHKLETLDSEKYPKSFVITGSSLEETCTPSIESNRRTRSVIQDVLEKFKKFSNNARTIHAFLCGDSQIEPSASKISIDLMLESFNMHRPGFFFHGSSCSFSSILWSIARSCFSFEQADGISCRAARGTSITGAFYITLIRIKVCSVKR